MLQGLIVDLVPFGTAFEQRSLTWVNNESSFWSNAGGRAIVSRQANEQWLERQRDADPKPRIHFGVQTKDGKPIGRFSVGEIDVTNRTVMLGAVIGETDYWGGGYGTDALLLVCEYCFDWLGVRKIWIATMALNERVLRQMERVGFTLEATLRDGTWADGEWVDMPFYGLMRAEWPGRETLLEQHGFRERWWQSRV